MENFILEAVGSDILDLWCRLCKSDEPVSTYYGFVSLSKVLEHAEEHGVAHILAEEGL